MYYTADNYTERTKCVMFLYDEVPSFKMLDLAFRILVVSSKCTVNTVHQIFIF